MPLDLRYHDRPANGGPVPFGGSTLPELEILLWPNRSLSARGFATLIGIVAAAFLLPLAALLGTMALWGVLPFILATIALLWTMIRRNNADGRMCEIVRLWPDRIHVARHDPGGRLREWEANPHWTRLTLRDDGPVESYLTLKGGCREIELGAFLSPEERVALHRDLEDALRRLSRPFPGRD